MIQELAKVTTHPQTEIYVGVPLVVLLVWAGKILYNTTIAQREMMATLFGTSQAPGVIPRHERLHDKTSKKINHLRDQVQMLAVTTGVKLHQRQEDEDEG